jgi:hypothetical protein
MIRKIALATIVAAALAAACGEPPPEAVSSSSAALYIDHTTGHGPVPCAGATPDHGFLDVWHPGDICTRVRGDFSGDEGSNVPHPGYVFAPGTDVSWVDLSPHSTWGYVCSHAATGPAYDPCHGQTPAEQLLTPGWNFIPFAPAAIVLMYLPECPVPTGMTTVHMCPTDWTPFDGSGYAAVRIDDGNPAHTLNLQNAPVNVDDCYIELGAYSASLAAQFTALAPPGYTHGTRVVAVYDGCP